MPTIWVKYANIGLCFLNYNIIAVLALAWLLAPFFSSKQQSKIRQLQLSISFELLLAVLYLTLFFVTLLGILPEYIVLPIPMILVFLIYLVKFKPQKSFSKKVIAPVLAIIMVLSILLPHLTAFACYNNILSQASAISNPEEKTTFISQYVYDTTAFDFPFLKEYLRANRDFQKYLLVGVGACGELAMATVTYLKNLGFEARKVVFPGEDHAFVEVKINGEWRVLDPGYYPSENLTRKERAERRLVEFGAISYIIAYVDSSFVELTQEYVPTDTIIIRVTCAGESLVGAQIILKHLFMSAEWSLPPLYTDGNGTVVLHLGALNYNDKAKEFEPYYRIIVDGKDTEFRATSTGSDQVHVIEIDLADIRRTLEIQGAITR